MPEELTVRRGSVGLGRSKSVRCSRVKFGLVSLDDDGDGDGDDDEGDQGSAKGKTKREAAKAAQIADSHWDGLEPGGSYGTLSGAARRVGERIGAVLSIAHS